MLRSKLHITCHTTTSSLPPITSAAQAIWLNTRKRGKYDVATKSAAEAAKTASVEKRKRRTRHSPAADGGDVEGMGWMRVP